MGNTKPTDESEMAANTGESAETENTDTSQDGQQAPAPVPYARFKEVIEELRMMKAQQAKAAKDAEKGAMAKLAEEKRFQELIEKLQPQAERASALEGVIKDLLKAKLATVPEDKRDLLPDGPPEVQLAWLGKAESAGLFARPQAPDTHAGAGSGAGADRLAGKVNEQEAAARVIKKYNLKPGSDWLRD